MTGIADRIEEDDLFLDSGVVAHGFAPHGRDYEVVIDVPAASPHGGAGYIQGRYVYRFTHCPEVRITSAVGSEAWRTSWLDCFIDYAEWERAGSPDGFVWGLDYADAYPGLSYVAGSSLAAKWSERLAHDMHEVRIETNVFDLSLVFHDLDVRRTHVGDAISRELSPVE